MRTQEELINLWREYLQMQQPRIQLQRAGQEIKVSTGTVSTVIRMAPPQPSRTQTRLR